MSNKRLLETRKVLLAALALSALLLSACANGEVVEGDADDGAEDEQAGIAEDEGEGDEEAPADETPQEPVDLGTFVYAFSAPTPTPQVHLIVAQEMGFFEDEGLEVEIEIVPDTNAAVRSGDVDAATTSAQALLRMHQEDPDAGIVAFFNYTPRYHGVYAAPADSGLTSIGDLEGLIVGVPSLQFAAYETARAELQSLGIDPDEDVTWEVTPDPPVIARSFETGTIDAVVNVDVIQVGVENLIDMEWTYLDPAPGFEVMMGPPQGAMLASVEERPEVFAAYARGVIRAWAFMDENMEAAADLMLDRFPELVGADESRSDARARVQGQLAVRHENQQPPEWADDDRYGLLFAEPFQLTAELEGADAFDATSLFTNIAVEQAWEDVDLDSARALARDFEVTSD